MLFLETVALVSFIRSREESNQPATGIASICPLRCQFIHPYDDRPRDKGYLLASVVRSSWDERRVSDARQTRYRVVRVFLGAGSFRLGTATCLEETLDTKEEALTHYASFSRALNVIVSHACDGHSV